MPSSSTEAVRCGFPAKTSTSGRAAGSSGLYWPWRSDDAKGRVRRVLVRDEGELHDATSSGR